MKTATISEADRETLISGVIAGRRVTITSGESIELPPELSDQTPLPFTRLVAVAIDSPDGRGNALFLTGGSAAALAGPILGVNRDAVSNFDWGTAAQPDSPVGQFLATVDADQSSARLLQHAQRAQE